MQIQQAAEREMNRMKAVFDSLKKKSSDSENAKEFYEFALNYYKDGIHFYKNEDYVNAFEAFIISWAYLDAGIKLGFFSVPDEQKKWFTA